MAPFTFSNDAQPFVPANCLRQPLNSNVGWMKTVRTNRCILELQVEAHAPSMFEVLSDPAIYEFERVPPPSVERLAAGYRLRESRVSPDGRERWLYGVHTFVAVLRSANFRSMGLLHRLGFQPGGPGNAEKYEAEPDEVVMLKAKPLAQATSCRT